MVEIFLDVYGWGVGSIDVASTGRLASQASVTQAAASISGLPRVAVTQAAASVRGSRTLTAIVASGPPAYPWNLFKGQVIGISLSRVGPLLKAHLKCSDYNRLWGLIAVGAPQPGMQLNLPDPPPDGTLVDIDPSAINYGEGLGDGGVVKFKNIYYWPGPQPTMAAVLNTNPDYSGNPIIDWTVASSTLDAWNQMFDARQGPFTRTWVDPDYVLQHRKVGQDGGEDQRVAAPYALDSDGPWDDTTIMPKSLTVDWDLSNVRRRIYIKGATIVSSGWFENLDAPVNSGEAYVDAQGCLSIEEAAIIADWHFRWVFTRKLSASASVDAGHDGWRVGQVVPLTDPVLARYQDVTAYEAIVMSVKGRLVSPGASDLGIEIDGVDWAPYVTEWSALTFGETGFGQPDSADLTIELFDEDGDLAVADNADVRLFKTGALAEIEYDLTLGDAPLGSLALQSDRQSNILPGGVDSRGRPIYKFVVTLYDVQGPWLRPGEAFGLKAQLTTADGVPVALAGATLIWEVVQWADDDNTITGTGFTLVNATGESDALGAAYNGVVFAAGGTATSYEVFALWLPY